MKIIFPLFFTLFLISACTNPDNTDQEPNAENPNTEVVDFVNETLGQEASKIEEVEKETEKITDNSKMVFKPKGEFPIPVYHTFDEIESLLQVDNDTTYIINFWATWCKPCVEELPYFEQIHKNYSDEKLRVVLVSLDFKGLIPHKLIPFMEKNDLQSDVVLLADPKASSWVDRVDKKWDGAIPVTVIYKGNKRKFIDHEVQDYPELNFHVNEILKANT